MNGVLANQTRNGSMTRTDITCGVQTPLIPAPDILKDKRHLLAFGAKEIGIRQLKELIPIGDSPDEEIPGLLDLCGRVVQRRVVVEGEPRVASGAACGILGHVVAHEELIAGRADSRRVARLHKVHEPAADEDIARVKTALTQTP
jgi:hypothetical protein